MAEFQLAEHLGKFHYEVRQMPCDEFDNWFLYFEWKTEQEKKARKKNAGKSNGGAKGKNVQVF